MGISKIKNFLDIDNLNKSLDVEEVKCVLRKLKQSKLPGIDSLTSKILECSGYNLLNQVRKLGEHVLDSEYNPKIWYHGMIYIIYELRPEHDPSIHCEIILTSCLVVCETFLVPCYTC